MDLDKFVLEHSRKDVTSDTNTNVSRKKKKKATPSSLLALAVTTHRCQRVPESVCPQWLSQAMKYPPTYTHTSTTHYINNTAVAHFFFLHRFNPPHPPFPPSFCSWWLHCCYGDTKPCTLKSALGRRRGEADNNIPLPRLTDRQSLVFVEVIMVALAEKGAV